MIVALDLVFATLSLKMLPLCENMYVCVRVSVCFGKALWRCVPGAAVWFIRQELLVNYVIHAIITSVCDTHCDFLSL